MLDPSNSKFEACSIHLCPFYGWRPLYLLLAFVGKISSKKRHCNYLCLFGMGLNSTEQKARDVFRFLPLADGWGWTCSWLRLGVGRLFPKVIFGCWSLDLKPVAWLQPLPVRIWFGQFGIESVFRSKGEQLFAGFKGCPQISSGQGKGVWGHLDLTNVFVLWLLPDKG